MYNLPAGHVGKLFRKQKYKTGEKLEERRMENGERRMENGKLKMENGKLKIETATLRDPAHRVEANLGSNRGLGKNGERKLETGIWKLETGNWKLKPLLCETRLTGSKQT